MHVVHGPILRTPDSKEGASAKQHYDDNVAYMDKTVGRLVGEIDKLGLREKTVIIYSADNGTATIGYQDQHDPDKTTGKIGGRAVNGHKGQLLEGGSRVPLIASWKGTLKPGTVLNDLVDFTDLLPTFADLAGASLPAGVKFDGRSFAPQLRGQAGKPREWIFVQLGAGWYVRDDGWKMNEKSELFAMKNSPFVEALVPADSTDPAAQAARKRLQAVLDELNPAGGKTVPPDAGNGKKKQNRKKAAAQKSAM
jgi:arylsulfatase A